MTEDATTPPPPAPLPSTSSTSLAAAPDIVGYSQLTQARVPLDEAGEAFSVPDANGRLPIVVLPKQPFRIQNAFVIGGAIAIVVGVLLDLDFAVRSGVIGLGGLLIFLGVFQSFIVPVPEGARALLLKAGRYDRTVGAGRHIVPPWIVVSHLVTVREIPFGSVALAVPTKDDVRVDIELLLTFSITEPERFVFAISAPDFDQVCQAAALDALRTLVRGKGSPEILDLGAADTAALKDAIGAYLSPYGVTVQRVVITSVQPPLEFMASREARRLASVQREEQTDRHALEERLQADREELERQRVAAKRERIELEAANEALRLQHLEERLAAYPAAAAYDVGEARLAIARSLAENTRAMVQLGANQDIADTIIAHTLADDHPEPAPARRSKATRATPRDGG